MVSMKKASAATDAKKIVQVEYNTCWSKDIWEIKEKAYRRFAKEMRNRTSAYSDVSKEFKSYWKGYTDGILFIIDELAKDFEDESEGQQHDVI